MPADDETTPKKYSWSYKNGKMNCCTSEKSTCNVSKLWEVSARSPFHDAKLARATKEINAILASARKANRAPDRELRFLQIEGRHLLAWVHDDLVSPNNDQQIVRKMLKLKGR